MAGYHWKMVTQKVSAQPLPMQTYARQSRCVSLIGRIDYFYHISQLLSYRDIKAYRDYYHLNPALPSYLSWASINQFSLA